MQEKLENTIYPLQELTKTIHIRECNKYEGTIILLLVAISLMYITICRKDYYVPC